MYQKHDLIAYVPTVLIVHADQERAGVPTRGKLECQGAMSARRWRVSVKRSVDFYNGEGLEPLRKPVVADIGCNIRLCI